MNKFRILIVDDKEEVRNILGKILSHAGYQVDLVSTGAEGVEAVKAVLPDLVVLDLVLPDAEGLVVLEQLKKIEPSLPVIILTGHESIKSAVEAMKRGAFHYMTKPFDNEELIIVVENAMKSIRLEEEVDELRRQVRGKYSFENIIGESKVMQKLTKLLRAVAATDVTVLIHGESGTGKELVARSLHNSSHRSDRRFTAIDCASLPETLIEAELFGHEKGAFTGAVRSRPGKFEITKGGTVFLDEIGNIPLSTQAKLLRVLEERRVEKLGGSKLTEIDVRILAATNANLEEATQKGLFREDLFHRLNEFPVHVPSLRERPEDIPLFIDHFVKEFNAEIGTKIKELSLGAKGLMMAYRWPGNVRELKNVIRRSMLLANNGTVLAKLLPKELRAMELESKPAENGEISLEPLLNLSLKEATQVAARQIEKTLIQKVLKEAAGRKGEAAQRLGIDEKTLYNKRREYNLL